MWYSSLTLWNPAVSHLTCGGRKTIIPKSSVSTQSDASGFEEIGRGLLSLPVGGCSAIVEAVGMGGRWFMGVEDDTGRTGGRWCYTRLFLPQWGVAPCEQTGVWGLAPTHGNYLRVYVRVYMCAHKALAWCKAFSALHIRKLSVGYVCASFRRFLLVLFFASLPAWARGGSG